MKKQIILKMKHFFKDYIKDIYIKLTFFFTNPVLEFLFLNHKDPKDEERPPLIRAV